MTREAKELDLFARLQGGAQVQRERVAYGTSAFVAAARRDYEAVLAHFSAARLPAAFRVKTMTAEVAASVRAFSTLHRAPAEVALNTIDGQKTFQVQVARDDKTHVLLLGPRGQELARGEVRGARVSWHW